MEKNVQESPQESNSASSQSFDVGVIVATQAHPYLPGKDFPKIGSYNHLTPPFMVIVEAHYSGKHDTETGEKLGSSFKCLYYSTETGKFEDSWFKKEELKLVERSPESLAKNCQDRSISQLKRKASGENEGLIGLQAILTTVDWELDKTMVYKDSNARSIVYKEKAILDFLPPLGTIIGVSKVQGNVQYGEETGRKTIDKGMFLVKVRWYNNKTSKFSEQDIPLSALKKVDPLCEVDYRKNKVYLYNGNNEMMDLEDSETKLKAIPVMFHDIIFNHYKYELRFRNVFTKELLLIEGKSSISTPISADYQTLIDNLHHVPETKNTEFKKGKWYKIQYVDKRRNYTIRIILVRNVKKDNNSSAISAIIEANCLLRNGAIRHFSAGRILRSEEITKKFACQEPV